ncbi:hypothetical protein F4780DRAFT_361747 [Xylariomycetidae sp. FL0641]|nr:hypothetical protein F4780DRAFT_361747 [Xylariomycetidae sp. FL0641]
MEFGSCSAGFWPSGRRRWTNSRTRQKSESSSLTCKSKDARRQTPDANTSKPISLSRTLQRQTLQPQHLPATTTTTTYLPYHPLHLHLHQHPRRQPHRSHRPRTVIAHCRSTVALVTVAPAPAPLPACLRSATPARGSAAGQFPTSERGTHLLTAHFRQRRRHRRCPQRRCPHHRITALPSTRVSGLAYPTAGAGVPATRRSPHLVRP